MCLSPITIKNPVRSLQVNAWRLSDLESGKSYHKIVQDVKYRAFSNYRNSGTLIVPCGKCVECAKKRQTAHAFRLYNRIKHNERIYHITLTYSNDTCPFQCVYQLVDKDTGECMPCCPSFFVDKEDTLCELRSQLPTKKKGIYPLMISQDFPNWFDESTYYQRVFTPSLKRKDVVSAIKVCKILFKRKYAYTPELVYSFSGEYGPKSNRPHYHCVFSSSQDISKFIALFNSYWQHKFGFTKCKCIRHFNKKDNSDAFMIVARYISKYVCKGSYEFSGAKLGFCEKGRVCQSMKMDTFAYDMLRPYHLAFDLFGEYDFNTFKTSSGESLSNVQICMIVNEVRKRMFTPFGHSKISIPRYIKDKLFYFTDSYGKKVKSSLSFLVSDCIQRWYDSREVRKIDSLALGRGYSEAFSISNCCEETSLRLRKIRLEEAYKNFLSRSWF